MKLSRYAIFFAGLLIGVASCKKSALDYVNQKNPATGGVELVRGSFVRASHATSGTVKLIVDSSNRRFLIFENFSTDNGADLRVWLSPNTGTSQYQEVGRLTAVSGSFSYELSSSLNTSVNNHVLIWCEDFSVLFGYAVLR